MKDGQRVGMACRRGAECSGSFYAVEDEIEIVDFQFFVIYYYTQKISNYKFAWERQLFS